jgi:hypothetical protein
MDKFSRQILYHLQRRMPKLPIGCLLAIRKSIKVSNTKASGNCRENPIKNFTMKISMKCLRLLRKPEAIVV